MSISYTWNFDSLEVYPTAYEQTNVVKTVFWTLQATLDENTLDLKGIQSIPYNSQSQFISYDELTHDTIYNWMTSSMGIETMNRYTASLERKINAMSFNKPETIIQKVPWQ